MNYQRREWAKRTGRLKTEDQFDESTSTSVDDDYLLDDLLDSIDEWAPNDKIVQSESKCADIISLSNWASSSQSEASRSTGTLSTADSRQGSEPPRNRHVFRKKHRVLQREMEPAGEENNKMIRGKSCFWKHALWRHEHGGQHK